MAQGKLDPALAGILGEARTAIDRGEYGLSLRLLEPLAENHRAVTPIGAGVRLLMATALMGLGEGEKAATCCRNIQGCIDPTLRARARELLQVLEAPALQRPRAWSLTLPDLGSAPTLEGTGTSRLRRRPAGPPPPPPPPVGETRSPRGFAAIALLLLSLLLLASMLGGCVEISSELRFDGPGRLQLSHGLRSPAGRSTPWQQRFQAALRQGGLPFRSEERTDGWDLSTPVLPASQALQALAGSVRAAAALSGVDLPEPSLHLRESNWLVGVRQQLSLDLNLTAIDPLPSLSVELRLVPLPLRAVRRATPALPIAIPAGRHRPPAVIWPLRPGEENHLEVSCWRWSPLGLGGLAVAGGLGLVLALQRIRLRLGFGLPQLPA